MNDIEIFGVPYLKKGSGIYIKKKNRGKFTEYCGGKVTDECISRAKKSNNPKLRKRATFAANARKWKHKKGGIIHKSLLKIAKSGTSLENPTKDTNKLVNKRPTPGFIPFTRRVAKKENKKDLKKKIK